MKHLMCKDILAKILFIASLLTFIVKAEEVDQANEQSEYNTTENSPDEGTVFSTKDNFSK